MAEATININVKTDNSGVKSLKQELKEANLEVQKLANAKVVDEAALNSAILKTAELKDRMNDVNEQVSVLTAGSKFEALGNQLGDIGSKILSLDFEGANESAQRLVKLTKTISLGDAVKGVKQLGSTFLNLGKALLTNPLFLIAAAIALAVAAVVKFLDKMGLLKKIGEVVGYIFEKIGEFIDFIVESASKAIDFLFGTTLVMEQQAQKQAEIQDKELAKLKTKVTAKTEAFDREIKEQNASGKNSEKVERQKLELIVKAAAVEFKIYQERFKNKAYLAGLDAEEIENQRKLYNESKKGLLDARSDLKVFNSQQQQEKDDAIKKDSEASKAAADKARAAAKQFRADRLAAERQFEDLRLSNLPEGVEKELAISAEKYKRLIEDTQKNEKLIASERLKITEELNKQQTASQDKIREDNRLKEEVKIKEQQDKLKSVYDEYYNFIEAQETDAVAKAEQERLEKYDNDLVKLQEFLDQKIITQEEFDAKEIELSKQTQDDIVKINADAQKAITDKAKEEADKRAEAEKALADTKIGFVLDGLSIIQSATELFGKGNEKAAKTAFNINKGAAIAEATISTYLAAQKAYASQIIPGDPTSVVRGGIAAGLAVASGLIKVAKISQTKFGSKSAPSGGNDASGSVPSSSAATSAPAAQPQINLFGQNNNANTFGAGAEGQPSTQAIQINSTVSVSEINAVQNKVAVQESRSTL